MIDIFFKVIDENSKPVTYKQSARFKPSILGSPCLRKIFYSYNCVLEDFGMARKNKIICDMGNYIHEYLSEIFRKANILVDFVLPDGRTPIGKYSHKPDHEFPLKDFELNLSLKIDAVLKIEDKLWIAEYKSIKGEDWLKLIEPKPEHRIQAMVYVYIFNKALEDNLFSYIPALSGIKKVEGIKFLYFSKDEKNWKQDGSGILKEFTVLADDDLFIKIVEKMEQVKQHTKTKTLPPKAEDFCFFCPYRTKCGKNILGI